ncbi:hypothetical protein H2200_004233 [Cladophialophora chaetospira]|uniref:Uncharacterized protein n=1 Tax=Cladophialophora chaetospira TaxID=386627 RepID=A0AA39CLU3_9EURO|nr:hypothetical protein H2200_004233 [Cladophialophora chaetospira]
MSFKGPAKYEQQPCPFYPRSVPQVPDCIKTPEIQATADFVNERLARFNEVDEKKDRLAARPHHEWGDKSAAHKEKQLWINMCPSVVLGLKHIQSFIDSKARAIGGGDALASFLQDTAAFSTMYTELRGNQWSYNILKPHMYEDANPENKARGVPVSEYMELRSALEDCDLVDQKKLGPYLRRDRPHMYLAYVYEAQKQWKMIKRYKAQLSPPGEEYGVAICSNEEIDAKLRTLSDVKTELEQQGVQVATVKWMGTNLRYTGPGSEDRSKPGNRTNPDGPRKGNKRSRNDGNSKQNKRRRH